MINRGYLSIQLIYFHFRMPTFWWSHYAHLFAITVPTYWWPRDAHLLTVLWWRLDRLFVCVRSFSLARCLPAELFLSVDCVLRSWRKPHCTIHTNSIFCTCKHRYITIECHTSKTMLLIHIGPNNSTQRMNIEQQDEIFYWLTGFIYNLTWYLVTSSARNYVVS